MSYPVDQPVKRESGLSKIDQQTDLFLSRLDLVVTELSNKLDRLRVTKPTNPCSSPCPPVESSSLWVAGHLAELDKGLNLVSSLEELSRSLDV